MLVISKSTLHNIVAMSLLLSMAGKGFAFCPATTVARLWGLGGSITTKNPHFTFSHGNRKSLWLLARSPSNNIGILYSPRLEFSSSTSINLATNAVGPSKSRSSSDWVVPETVDIPEDKLDFSFVRSSGAGGQNVNKVSQLYLILRISMGCHLFSFLKYGTNVTLNTFSRLIPRWKYDFV